MTIGSEPVSDGTGGYRRPESLATTPAAHTMGARLSEYVLPKVPVSALIETCGRVRVYGDQSLWLLLGGIKRQGKRFNWRRPFFTTRHGLLHCVVAPGQDYTHHYARLVATACELVEIPPRVIVDIPAPDQAVQFIDRWLPRQLPRADVIVLGYVERLFKSYPTTWATHTGFGWRSAVIGPTNVALVGCEFSYWGDLAGALVTVLAERGRASWVIYVGKLGALTPSRVPNQHVATGTRSYVAGREVTWGSHLDLGVGYGPILLTDQRHITVPSTFDETCTWHARHAAHFDVVDPEIGRMAHAAKQASIQFDYLHIVSDNLCGHYEQGLYDERAAAISASRQGCIAIIESILRRSFS